MLSQPLQLRDWQSGHFSLELKDLASDSNSSLLRLLGILRFLYKRALSKVYFYQRIDLSLCLIRIGKEREKK